ncbi:aldehyde dehydrogenase family protein [Microcella alkaliphila]|uniref:Gamma-aminobutyraldehyde dehydrogenase n=1 Tax=Microcella alkaliphila TaxID=279828 RepID=A0A0U4X0K4_9MICO|nr:aldehyde dehydrogenase family protein [Microcella alkaliphila]BAU33466.1 gamma-aminobutyraldehyde dehydrogenase [Microcella alkaliphila]
MSHQQPAHFIDGEWVAPLDGGTRTIINPATGEAIAVVAEGSPSDVDRAVDAAQRAFRAWRKTTPRERSLALEEFAARVESRKEELIQQEALNGGKPLFGARWEIEDFVIDGLKFFAGAARHLDGIASADYQAGRTSSLRREPLGVIAGIVPWNYPAEIAAWKIGPVLAAGNTLVLKPSEGTPLSALLLAEIAADCLPPGVLNLVLGDGVVGAAMAEHPGIAGISVTGSERTGVAVAERAARNLKHVDLELGGNAPVVVFSDAELPLLIETLRMGTFYNAGQDCTAATRLLVHASVYDKFLTAATAMTESIVYGDPLAEGNGDVEMGPLATEVQRERVDYFVRNAVAAGSRVVTGGRKVDGPGYFYQPTIVDKVRQEDPIVQEEVFGPLMTVQSFESEEEAIMLANGVRQGLSASVWTQNVGVATRVSNELDFGTVWVNEHLPLVSELPHSGHKMSGYGHSMSRYNLEQYTSTKHIMVRHDR